MTEPDAPPPTRRREKLIGLGLLLAVLVALPLISTQLRLPSDRADLPAIERTSAPPPTSVDIDPANVAEIISVDFADRRHGFALWSHCIEDAPATRCRQRFLTTSDGENWTVRNFPGSGFEGQDGGSGYVVALGKCRVLLSGAHPEKYHTRLFSDDCGRNWVSVPLKPAGSISEIPEGATLASPCTGERDEVDDCDDGRLVVTVPDSGRRIWLDTSPALEDPSPESVPADDGAWWVSGRDSATGRRAVAVSRDQGRSWSVSRLPRWQARQVHQLPITMRGKDAYALAVGSLRDVRSGLLAIFHSEDGGETWEQTWQAAPGDSPRSIAGSPIAGPRGVLIILDESVPVHHRSLDGGRTFDAAIFTQPISSPRRMRGGYLATSDGSPRSWYRAVDGVRWRKINFPGVP